MDLSLRAQDLAHAGPRRAWPRHRDPVLVAVFAVAVSAAGAARPSLWYDEAATISASTRSVAERWQMVRHVDAVHGVYYLAMHGWFTVVPPTEFRGCRAALPSESPPRASSWAANCPLGR